MRARVEAAAFFDSSDRGFRVDESNSGVRRIFIFRLTAMILNHKVDRYILSTIRLRRFRLDFHRPYSLTPLGIFSPINDRRKLGAKCRNCRISSFDLFPHLFV